MPDDDDIENREEEENQRGLPGDEGVEPAADPTSIVPAREVFPGTLLLVPLTDRPIFPRMVGPVLIADEGLKGIIQERARSETAQFVGLVLVETVEAETVEVEADAGEGGASPGPGAVSVREFPKVGVVARILRISPIQPGLPLQILVQALERFEIVEIVSQTPVLHATVRYRHESEYEMNEEIKAYSLAIIDSIKELIQLNPLYKEGLSLILDKFNVNNPGLLADFAASMTTATGAELQRILETRSIRSRIEHALVLLHKELEISKLKVQIGRRIEERLSKQQREFFLKEQLKEIKKELGIRKEDTETEVEKFRARLEGLDLPEEARERVEQELDKLGMLETSSPEFSVTRAYLDWLTELPWGVYTEDNYDIGKASRILDEDHYGLADVKERILELISVGIVKGDLAGSIILLVGPPGVGKTSIGRSIARALGRKFYRFSLGGMRDEAEIKGHRRTYIGALPGKFIQAMKTCGTANPLIMLDEIDKVGASFRGDPASALLEVLDPEQNRDFLDHYLDVRFDLSKVLFICTANQLETIPRPLLDRMETIRLSGYILEEKLEIARGFLIPKQLERHGLTPKQVTISKAVLREIVEGYAREAGVRSLENSIKKIMRKAARAIVENDVKRFRVRVRDLPDLLGRRVFAEEKAFRRPRIGVVTGLAYTTLGGATLHIEAAAVASRTPGFKQTGQLGGVMVESSEIAYTYVRSLLKGDEKARDFFARHLVHLHVPAGATPKDGPSAGITMACALYSLAVGRPIARGLAMTGELTLSGLVMPIGGLKEKVIAAKRAGLTRLIFPADNRADFEALDEAVRGGIEPHFVRTFEEVLRIGFPRG
jgi:ATP-dependent Lon protease